MVRIIPTKTSIDAEEYAYLFVIFAKHGLPRSIVSDKGPSLTGFFQKVCVSLMIHQTYLLPLIYRLMDKLRGLEEMLRAFVGIFITYGTSIYIIASLPSTLLSKSLSYTIKKRREVKVEVGEYVLLDG